MNHLCPIREGSKNVDSQVPGSLSSLCLGGMFLWLHFQNRIVSFRFVSSLLISFPVSDHGEQSEDESYVTLKQHPLPNCKAINDETCFRPSRKKRSIFQMLKN